MRIVPGRASTRLPGQVEHALEDAPLGAVLLEDGHVLAFLGEPAVPLLDLEAAEVGVGGHNVGQDLDPGHGAREDCITYLQKHFSSEFANFLNGFSSFL